MRWLTGVVAVAALVVAGCGGTVGAGAGASDVVPASAAAFIAVDTNPDSSQWNTIEDLASRFPDEEKGVRELKRSFHEDTGLRWENDIKPALGDEVDVVWLDFKNDGDNVVALLQPKDEAKFKEVIAKANAKDPKDPDFYEKYRGWYVFADKRALIDRFKRASDSASQTLSDVSDFRRSMDKLGSDAVARAYVSGDAIMNVIRQYGGSEVRPYLEKAGTLNWLAAKIGAKEDGVGLDVIVHGTPGKLFKGIPTTNSFKPKLLDDVPQDAFAYYTFHGTKNMFSALEKNELFKTPEFRQLAGPLRQIGTILQGENALYVRPGNSRSADVPFDIPEVTLIAAPGDGVDGAAIVDRLLRKQGGVVPQRTKIAGADVRKLATPGGLGLYYANLDGKLVATDLPAGIRTVKDGRKSLSDNETFKQTKESSGLPDKSQGFLYVDIHSTIPVVEKLAQQRVPNEIRRNLKPLRSAIEYGVSRSHELQVTFFLRIK